MPDDQPEPPTPAEVPGPSTQAPPIPAGTAAPVRPGKAAMSKGAAIALSSALGLIALVLLLVFVVRLASQSGGGALGDDTFDINASTLASQIDRNGPILFPDLLGRGRDIYIQHLSDDRKEGWLAFRATAPGAERPCTLRWDGAERLFRDPCDASRTYPADGEGLEQYRAAVVGENKLVVDLRGKAP